MSPSATSFLTIHSTYTSVSLGIFTGETEQASISFDHKTACAVSLAHLEALLVSQDKTLRDLSFIAVNQGPGPYTTLRITLSLADGLSFASGIPLVGVDGFAAFVQEISDARYDYTVILLNAFCHELFYAIRARDGGQMITGYDSIAACVELLNGLGPASVLLAGNGVPLLEAEVKLAMVPMITRISPFRETPSRQAVARLAAELWQQGVTSRQLLPLYLKRPNYRTSATPAS
ncbi:MAG: tRNA (adenosine(37)-N6)-threonylcarbamoyltransferase complex dimerization subunit type 1 TsaB [Candidatus Dependentiae bacterium]|nr:tRNA (adenosine(37)-N6)-threonylcarbamoyltransferase complex dimerization subunit type 1 TsaB [Candidatus Dependentiae bacterium]